MWPLLEKDDLAVQYVATLLGWNYLIGYNPIRLPNSVVKFTSLVSYPQNCS